MIQFSKRLLWDRRGNALAIAAAALPVMIGSAGLATDTIQWTVWKRQLQRAADSAALAGVHGLIAGQTPVGSCASGTPVRRDLDENNQVLAGAAITNCVAENSPGTGPSAADPNAVRVTLTVQKQLPFSSLFLSSTPSIQATATATVVESGKYCVVSLEDTNATGLTYQGSATVSLGCGMKTNSRGTCATQAGGSANVTASPIAAVGGICNSGSVFSEGTILQPYSPRQPDPFENVNPPSTFPNQTCPNLNVNSNTTLTTLQQNTHYRLMPGTTNQYCLGSMSLNGNVTLPSGIYVLDGGSLSIGAQAQVTCSGCTFIFTSRNAASNPNQIGGISNINGGATINMTATNSGTYSGLLMYQDRRAILPNGNQSNQVNGNSSSTYQGAFYFPKQRLTFNGTSGMTTNCVQMVARQVTFSGNTNISNVCPPNSGTRTFDATTVRLIA